MDANELLSSYALGQSEAAFTEFVARHFNLVYSAALRQVGGNRQLASDVAQKVFTDAARKARRLSAHPAVAAWLFTSTRHASAEVLRAEHRRLRREHRSYAMNATESAPEPPVDWTEVRPVIDEAMHRLGDAERTALILRYFEQVSVGEIARRLGLTERGTRKLVERSLESLRRTLSRHGITSTSTALATALAGGAVSAAPAGVASTVAQAALAGAAGGWTAPLVLLPLMTTLQKSLIAFTALALLGGFAANQVVSRQRDENDALHQQNERLVRHETQLQRERDETRRLLAGANPPAADPQNDPQPPTSLAPAALTGMDVATKVSRLKALFDSMPASKIPELDLLEESEWEAILQNLSIENELQIVDAMSRLRNASTHKAASLLARATNAYQVANGPGSLVDPSQLAGHFSREIPPAMLQRYEIVTNPDTGRQSLSERRSAIIDPQRDDWHQQQIVAPGQGGWGFSGNALQTDLAQARKEYAAANNGAEAQTLGQLAPFMKTTLPAEPKKERSP